MLQVWQLERVQMQVTFTVCTTLKCALSEVLVVLPHIMVQASALAKEVVPGGHNTTRQKQFPWMSHANDGWWPLPVKRGTLLL